MISTHPYHIISFFPLFFFYFSFFFNDSTLLKKILTLMILLTLLVGPLQLFFVCLGLLLCLTLEFFCTVVLTKVQYVGGFSRRPCHHYYYCNYTPQGILI